MPRRVDPHQRRTAIADALLRVAAADGLEAVSLRHVAAEAGVSAGMVQHYFRTKEQMMTFAMEVVQDRTGQRISATLAALGPQPAPREFLRTLFGAMLPTDEQRRREAGVALGFLAYATAHPESGGGLREGVTQLRAFVDEQLRATGVAVPEHAATTLLAVVEGLSLYLLGGHYPPETALAALDTQLALLLD